MGGVSDIGNRLVVSNRDIASPVHRVQREDFGLGTGSKIGGAEAAPCHDDL